MKFFFTVLSFFTVISTISSQIPDSCNYVLKGIVLDEDTQEAMPYVQILIEGTQQFALTDDNGEFELNKLCDLSNVLTISYLGYSDNQYEYDIEKGSQVSIYLKKGVNSIETVTIKAEKGKEKGTASISQQRLNKEILSIDPTRSLASALSAVEGVTVTSVGTNVQLPVIHGLYGNRVLILNNGIKHGFQNWGSDHGPEIDVASASSVTVVKGAAGVRYGAEALGGAIIVEADPLNFTRPFNTKFGTGYQTNGRGYYFNSEISKGAENWSYHMGGNYTRIGDRHSPDYSLTNSGKEEKSFNGGFRYKLKTFDVKLYYSFLDQNLAVLRSSVANSGTAIVRAFNSDVPNFIRDFSYDINEPNQLAQHHLGKVEVNWWYTEDAKFTLRIGSQLNKREEYDVRRNAEFPIIDLDLVTNDFQLDWKHPEWYGFDGLIGVQAFTQNNDNNPGTFNTPFIPNYNTSRYSIFLIESLKRGRSAFEFGIRLDYEWNNVRGREPNQDIFRDEYSFTNFTSSIGYVFTISENNTFRTNLATAWRTPNMSELFSFGQHGFRTSFGLLRYYTDENENGAFRTDRVIPLEESDVSPEKGYKWINEWRVQNNSSTFTFTGYGNYIQNFIYDRPLAVIGTIRGPQPVFIHDQADALFLGLDFSWQEDWSNSLKGTLGMSYLWSQNLKKNETLINQPPVRINYQLDWEIPSLWKSVTSELTLNPSYTFRQFQAPRTVRPEDLIDGTVNITTESEIFDFKDAPEGYFLLDVGWRMRSDKFEAGLSIQNVFNARYRNYLNEMRYFADEPGINFLFSINYFLN
ncbi:MAG: TonB-dependent receptor [Bacteroidota bacterium]